MMYNEFVILSLFDVFLFLQVMNMVHQEVGTPTTAMVVPITWEDMEMTVAMAFFLMPVILEEKTKKAR